MPDFRGLRDEAKPKSVARRSIVALLAEAEEGGKLAKPSAHLLVN